MALVLRATGLVITGLGDLEITNSGGSEITNFGRFGISGKYGQTCKLAEISGSLIHVNKETLVVVTCKFHKLHDRRV